MTQEQTTFTPLYGKVTAIGPKVIMADGSPCREDHISWWYEGEDEEGNYKDKHLAYVMDFSRYFPYWEELKMEGYNHVEEIDGVWYWAVREKNY